MGVPPPTGVNNALGNRVLAPVPRPSPVPGGRTDPCSIIGLMCKYSKYILIAGVLGLLFYMYIKLKRAAAAKKKAELSQTFLHGMPNHVAMPYPPPPPPQQPPQPTQQPPPQVPVAPAPTAATQAQINDPNFTAL